jgi:hypothetical protein
MFVLPTNAGPVTPGTVAANSGLAGGQYNTVLPTLTNTQQSAIQLDSSGRLIVAAVPLDGSKATYSAAITGLASGTTATDIFTLTGSATKTIRISHVRVSATASSPTYADVLFIKRSSANTAGTSTSPAAVPNDSANAAASATVRAYTVNPTTLGTTVGTIRSAKLLLSVPTPSNAQTSGVQIPIEGYFGELGQAIVLRGAAEVFAININGVTYGSSSFDIAIEWTEE